MPPSFRPTQNKPRSLSGPDIFGSMSPEVFGLICLSVLVLLVLPAAAIIAIRLRRQRSRPRFTTQVEAQVPVLQPVASEGRLDGVFLPLSTSSSPYEVELRQSPVDSDATHKMSNTLDDGGGESREAMLKESWVTLARDPSTPLADVDAAIVAAVMNAHSGAHRSVSKTSDASRVTQNNTTGSIVYTAYVPRSSNRLVSVSSGSTIYTHVHDASSTKQATECTPKTPSTPETPSTCDSVATPYQRESVDADAVCKPGLNPSEVAIDHKQSPAVVVTLSLSLSAHDLSTGKRDVASPAVDLGDAKLAIDEQHDLTLPGSYF